MVSYAVAPLLCALLFLFSQGSALSRENLQLTLYVDPAVADGPNRNSIFSVGGLGAGGFGSIYMRDRPMLDGLGRKANIVGRMMDTNFKTSVTAPSKNIWSISMNLVFDDTSRFSGSTLQVAGINTVPVSEWSIVGGTGKFTMARGTIVRKIIKVPGSTRSEKLTIDVYYTRKPSTKVSGDTGMVAPV